jgi:hypothetical protein
MKKGSMNRREGARSLSWAALLLATGCPPSSTSTGTSPAAETGATTQTQTQTQTQPRLDDASPSPTLEPHEVDARVPPEAGARCANGCSSLAGAYATLLPDTRAHPCMQPSKAFPDVLPVGRFVPDFGCVPEGIVFACCLRTPTEVAAEKFAGWPSSAVETRKAQALTFTREVILAFETILDAPPTDFTEHNRAFSSPIVTALPGGGEAVTVWLHERAGPSKRTVYTAQQVRFGPTGSVERVAQIAQWTP